MYVYPILQHYEAVVALMSLGNIAASHNVSKYNRPLNRPCPRNYVVSGSHDSHGRCHVNGNDLAGWRGFESPRTYSSIHQHSCERHPRLYLLQLVAACTACRWVLIVAEVRQGRAADEETAEYINGREAICARDKCVDRPIGGIGGGEKKRVIYGESRSVSVRWRPTRAEQQATCRFRKGLLRHWCANDSERSVLHIRSFTNAFIFTNCKYISFLYIF